MGKLVFVPKKPTAGLVPRPKAPAEEITLQKFELTTTAKGEPQFYFYKSFQKLAEPTQLMRERVMPMGTRIFLENPFQVRVSQGKVTESVMKERKITGKEFIIKKPTVPEMRTHTKLAVFGVWDKIAVCEEKGPGQYVCYPKPPKKK
jgi:hypothetical protein